MKSILRCLALLFALSSCEQVIEPDLPEPYPTAGTRTPFFTADGIWTAYVGRSSGILESRPRHERSVSVSGMPRWSCWRGDRVVEEMKFLEAARVYAFEDSTLEVGETYSLQVSAPGFATIRATDAIPKPVPTSILSYRPNASVRSGSEISRRIFDRTGNSRPPRRGQLLPDQHVPGFHRERGMEVRRNLIDKGPFDHSGQRR